MSHFYKFFSYFTFSLILTRYESDSEPSSMVIVDNEESRGYIFDPYIDGIEETGHYISHGFSDEIVPDELSIIYEEENVVMNSLSTTVDQLTACKHDEETTDALDATDNIETMTNEEHIPVTHKSEEFETKNIHQAGCDSPVEAELSGLSHQTKEGNSDVTEVVDRVVMWRGAATTDAKLRHWSYCYV